MAVGWLCPLTVTLCYGQVPGLCPPDGDGPGAEAAPPAARDADLHHAAAGAALHQTQVSYRRQTDC